MQAQEPSESETGSQATPGKRDRGQPRRGCQVKSAREELTQMKETFGMTCLRRLSMLVALTAVAIAVSAAPASAAFEDYGVASSSVELSTNQAGAHPDLHLNFALKTDPDSAEDPTGLHAPYARTR